MTTEELINLNSTQLLHKMEELRSLAVNLGAEWAEKQHAYKSIKEMMPSFLAIIQQKFLGPKMIISEAKMHALADPEYTQKITDMNQAEFEMEKTLAEYKAAIKSLEVLSSISYVRNNELKLGR